MTTIHSASRPYAKAAFEAAKTANQLSMWSNALKQLSLVVQDSQIKSILKNPTYTKKQLSDLLDSFLHAVSGNGSSNGFVPIENFIQLLAEKKRLAMLPEISSLFEDACAKESGCLALTVTSSFEMDALQKNNVTEKLSKQFNSKCEIEFKIDKSLLGGLLIRSNDWVLDGTVKGALERLRAHI